MLAVVRMRPELNVVNLTSEPSLVSHLVTIDLSARRSFDRCRSRSTPVGASMSQKARQTHHATVHTFLPCFCCSSRHMHEICAVACRHSHVSEGVLPAAFSVLDSRPSPNFSTLNQTGAAGCTRASGTVDASGRFRCQSVLQSLGRMR